MSCIGIFGGTFDPVHYGHLRTAFELLERLPLTEVRFIPCSIPPHRTAQVTAGELRQRMLEAAVAGTAEFTLDRRELERPGPSYSVDTMRSLRADLPDASLCLLLGMDAFLELPTWREWERLLDFGHIVVANRPGWRVPTDGAVGGLLHRHATESHDELVQDPFGKIHIEEVTQLEIASTEIRRSVRAGVSAKYLLPDAVLEIMVESNCYGA